MKKVTLLLTAVFVLLTASLYAQQNVSRDGLGQLLYLMYFDHVPENEFNKVFQNFMKSNYPGQNIFNPAEVRAITSGFVFYLLTNDAVTAGWEKYSDAAKAREAEQQAAARQKQPTPKKSQPEAQQSQPAPKQSQPAPKQSQPAAQQPQTKVSAQERQQALDEIARIEKVIAQTPEMLRQAWEAGRTQTDTVIDTPYGKVTIKFNLDELIRETYTGDLLDYKLKNRHGEMSGSELRINNGGSWKNEYPEGMKATITHELGHYMMDRIRSTPLAPPDKYRAVEDISEIDADAFAMRYIGKDEYIKQLNRESNSQDYINAVIKRMEEVEREERETLARLRAIANDPDAASVP